MSHLLKGLTMFKTPCYALIQVVILMFLVLPCAADETSQTIRVASIQMETRNHDTDGNLLKATQFVKKAAEDGADIVLLPEMFAAGYQYTEDFWLEAETMDGKTVQWLKRTRLKTTSGSEGRSLKLKKTIFTMPLCLLTAKAKSPGQPANKPLQCRKPFL